MHIKLVKNGQNVSDNSFLNQNILLANQLKKYLLGRKTGLL